MPTLGFKAESFVCAYHWPVPFRELVTGAKNYCRPRGKSQRRMKIPSFTVEWENMRHIKSIIGIIIGGFILLALPVRGQNSTKPQTAVQTSVGDIADTRTTVQGSDSQCKIELKFTGDAASDAVCVKEVNIDEALDETGRDLKTGATHDNWNEFSSFEDVDRPLSAEIVLKNPSRNATLVKVLKGEAKLFVPSEANGGIVRVKDFLKTSSKPPENPIFKRFDITITHLSLRDFQLLRQNDKTNDATEAEAEAAGLSLKELKEFETDLQSQMISDSQKSVLMLVKDPKNKIVKLEIHDVYGKRLRSGSFTKLDDFQQIGFDIVPPDDSQLVVWLATPDSIRTCPFEFHNIPLP